jgi:hypothetical protein
MGLSRSLTILNISPRREPYPQVSQPYSHEQQHYPYNPTKSTSKQPPSTMPPSSPSLLFRTCSSTSAGRLTSGKPKPPATEANLDLLAEFSSHAAYWDAHTPNRPRLNDQQTDPRDTHRVRQVAQRRGRRRYRNRHHRCPGGLRRDNERASH